MCLDMLVHSALGRTCVVTVPTFVHRFSLDFGGDWMLSLDVSVEMILLVGFIIACLATKSFLLATAFQEMISVAVVWDILQTVHTLLFLMTSLVIPVVLSCCGNIGTQITLQGSLLVNIAEMILQFFLILE